MQVNFTLIILYLIICITINQAALQLELVIEISRHGARAPMYNNIDAN